MDAEENGTSGRSPGAFNFSEELVRPEQRPGGRVYRPDASCAGLASYSGSISHQETQSGAYRQLRLAYLQDMDALNKGLSVDLPSIDEHSLCAAQIMDPDVVQRIHDCTMPAAHIGVFQANPAVVEPPNGDDRVLPFLDAPLLRDSESVLFSTRKTKPVVFEEGQRLQLSRRLREDVGLVRDHSERLHPRLPVTRIGRLLRYHVEDFEHFIQSQRASGKRRAV